MFVNQVQKIAIDNHLWHNESRVLIAVSTGVDSMVLLHLLQELTSTGIAIGVAHVNHQLREVSMEEEAFIADYCEKAQIPFYMKRWQVPVKGNIESLARTFRYEFFEEIMEKHGYDVLVTAHHQEDQVETILMKMVRTGDLFASQGIVLNQTFASGRLVRPLLFFSKEQIRQYAKEHALVYFEDETNQTLQYQRNRFRHQVLPVLKNENKQSFPHFQQLSEQIQEVGDWLGEQQQAWFSHNVQVDAQSMAIDLTWYQQASAFEQKYFLKEVARQAQVVWGIVISKKQLVKVQVLLEENQPSQWQVDLVEDWHFARRYGMLYLRKQSKTAVEAQTQLLELGETIYLSDHQWIGYFPKGEEKIPEKVKLWSEFRQEFCVDSVQSLILRKRQAGDRILLNENLNKKVSRYFIDQKIPLEERDEAWLIMNQEQKIIGILPYTLSYLSIMGETDKIHYVLLFKYKK